MLRRPYFFEVFTIVNFAIVAISMSRLLPPRSWVQGAIFLPPFLGFALAGVAVRAGLAWREGHGRDYLRVLRSGPWVSDTLRLILFCALSSFTYAVIKLFLPVEHPRLFDQELWNLDAGLFLGHSPNVFFLALFSSPLVLKAIDWTYANVFLASLWIASMYFLSSPSRRLRVAFMNSNVVLWITGAWLYLLFPSLGPAYRFPDLWQPLSASLGRTQYLQRLLMTNYQAVLHGSAASILYGIAAFPSLHVGFVALAFFWMRRLHRWGALLFGIFTILIFAGSIVTGWHYLIDAMAGLVMAWLCYAVASRVAGLQRAPNDIAD